MESTEDDFFGVVFVLEALDEVLREDGGLLFLVYEAQQVDSEALEEFGVD